MGEGGKKQEGYATQCGRQYTSACHKLRYEQGSVGGENPEEKNLKPNIAREEIDSGSEHSANPTLPVCAREGKGIRSLGNGRSGREREGGRGRVVGECIEDEMDTQKRHTKKREGE